MNREKVDQFCLVLQGGRQTLLANGTAAVIEAVKIVTSPKVELEDFCFGRLTAHTLITTEITSAAGVLRYYESNGEVHNATFERR
jgi:hypothetical protein